MASAQVNSPILCANFRVGPGRMLIEINKLIVLVNEVLGM